TDPDDDHKPDMTFLNPNTGEYFVLECKTGSGKSQQALRQLTNLYADPVHPLKILVVDEVHLQDLNSDNLIQLSGSPFLFQPPTIPNVPGWCDYLMRALMDPERRLSFLGDIEEDFHENVRTKGHKHAVRRYHFEVAMMILRQVIKFGVQFGEWLFRIAR